MRHTIFIILIGFGLAFLTGCSADEKDDISASITVEGVVTSDLGQPLEAVLVKSSQDSAFTNQKGGYTVRAYPRGALEFHKAGFRNHIEPVAEQRVVNVTLKRILDGSATRYDPRQIQVKCGEDTSAVATVVEITDFGQGAGTMTWTKNKIWVLKNSIFVNEGQTLTIEPGTIVKGAAGSPDSTGSLIVAKGGLLIANGAPELPIIFTAESDSIVRDTTGHLCRGTNLTRSDRGLWGGLILFGSAPVNADTASIRLDGFPEIETRVSYGGKNDSDNSGALRYLSIRHAGRLSSGATLAGVGSGATFEHVEVYACRSRGFRFLGGKVNTRYLVSASNGVDAFYFKNGWQGLNQFWLAVGNGGAAVSEGSETVTDSLGKALGPVIANATFSGPYSEAGQPVAAIRGAMGGEFHNCIFVKYAAGVTVTLPEDSTKLSTEQFPVFKNCSFGGLSGDAVFTPGEKNSPAGGNPKMQAFLRALNDRFQNEADGNLLAGPGLGPTLIPGEGVPAAGRFAPTDSFFEITGYRGCYAPGQPAWISGWALANGDF